MKPEQPIDIVDAALLVKQLREFLADGTRFVELFSKNTVIALVAILNKNIGLSFQDMTYEEKLQVNTRINLKIQNLLPEGSLPLQPEVCPATAHCPRPELYSCVDGVATEIEVLEYLYALVRMYKPELILETGTYLGYGALYLRKAVLENKIGRIYSCDTSSLSLEKATKLLAANGCVVALSQQSGEDLIKSFKVIDFLFIDSGDQETRVKEIELALPRLSKSGIICIHDTQSPYYKYEKLALKVKTLQENGRIHSWTHPSPRGLTVIQNGKN